FLTEGNDHLRAMVKAKQAERFDEVARLFEKVKALVKEMQEEKREEFGRNAAAVLERAKGIADMAARLKRIKEFAFEIRAIVVDPRPDGKNRCVIVTTAAEAGRVYAEGDTVEDTMKVVTISEGSVKFVCDDIE